MKERRNHKSRKDIVVEYKQQEQKESEISVTEAGISLEASDDFLATDH